MFDQGHALDSAVVESWRSALTEIELPSTDAAAVDEIRALEELVCAARARQRRLARALDDSSRDGRGVAEQVALARRESPHRGRQHLALARIDHGFPWTMVAFDRGLVAEWRVMQMARETACLSAEDRFAVDRALAADAEAFAAMSDRAALGEVRKHVARLDPGAVAERRRRAEGERRVTIRPAPDTMVYLTALLPVAEGVAAYAALCADIDRARLDGDPRSRGQVMADVLVARITGCATASDGRPVVPVSVGLVMSDLALLAGAHDDAALVDHGPIPAGLARELVLRNLDAGSRSWVRRLYRHPESSELVSMDARQRIFPKRLASFLRYRDQWCRTPWCDAPIRHSDHVLAVAAGGDTNADGGRGLCESCNYAKEAAGWRHRPRPGPDGHEVEITTPTGHRYRSRPPTVVGPRTPAYRQVEPGRWVLVA